MTSNLAPYQSTSVVLPEDYSQLLVRSNTYFTQQNIALNQREIAFYQLTETITGQTWPAQQGATVFTTTFRKIFNIGAIAQGATSTIPHGITTLFAFTKIFGTIKTDVPDERPLPFVAEAVVTEQVSVKIVGANIVIVSGATAANITSGILILEYLKN